MLNASIRWFLMSIVFLAAIVPRVAFAQIIIEPAEDGQVAVLSATGSSNIGDGFAVSVDATGATAATLFVSYLPLRAPTPLGLLELDPAGLFIADRRTAPASGPLRWTKDTYLAPAAGFEIYGQVLIERADGSLQLSNRLVHRATTPGTSATTRPILDPFPLATALPNWTFTGTLDNPGAMLVVRGGSREVTAIADSERRFSISVPLVRDRVNRLDFFEVPMTGPPGPPQTLSITQDSTAPEIYIDAPVAGQAVNGTAVTVVGTVSDRLSGALDLRVQVNGVVAEVVPGIGTNGTFEARNVPLNPNGALTTLTAVATDGVGLTASAVTTAQSVPLTGERLELLSGGSQSAVVNNELANPVRVRLLRANGAPFSDKLIEFEVVRSDGALRTVSAGSTPARLIQVRSNAQGMAEIRWRLGSEAGCGNNRIRITSRDVAGDLLVCASATPAPNRQINVSQGNNQCGCLGGVLPDALRVWVSDGCNSIAGQVVRFTVESGEGGLYPNLSASTAAAELLVTTDAAGRAEVFHVLGQEIGRQTVRAELVQSPGTAVRFHATATVRTVGQDATLQGYVVDDSDRPLANARCELHLGNYHEVSFTDPTGRFQFTQIAEEGLADLHIEGATVNQAGGQSVAPGSYPPLHFEPNIVAGAANRMPQTIRLPAFDPRNIFRYSTSQPTELRVEGIDGLVMTVLPGSMRFANGALAPEGTVLRLNQVHVDDIPMPMTDGAAPPFAWSLQPAGATFNPPIRIQYPNMSGLAPGARSYFLSFDHDTMRFEIVSGASVDAEGALIHSDPGDGLSISGWGCNCPPYSVTTDCDGCSTFCRRGSITMGLVSTDILNRTSGSPRPIPGDTIEFRLISADDSGGEFVVVCPTGTATTPAPPVPVDLSWVLTGPMGNVIGTGVGSVAVVSNVSCGVYSILYTGAASRLCEPPIQSRSGSIIVSQPTVAPIPAISGMWGINLDPQPMLSSFLGRLVAVGVSGGFNASYSVQPTVTCCPDGSVRPALEDGNASLVGNAMATVPIGAPIFIGIPLVGLVTLRLQGQGTLSISAGFDGWTLDPCDLTWSGNSGGSISGSVGLVASATTSAAGLEASVSATASTGITGTIWRERGAGTEPIACVDISHDGVTFDVSASVMSSLLGITQQFNFRYNVIAPFSLYNDCFRLPFTL